MSYKLGVDCGSCSRNNEIDGDCTCVDCTHGGQLCLPNNPDRVRGGKRRLNKKYRRFDGAFENTPSFKEDRPIGVRGSGRNLLGYAIGLISVGVLVYVIGYSFNKGKKEA